MSKSITLGGKATVSLETGGRGGAPISEERIVSPLPEAIDVDGLIAAVGLGEDEQKFLQAKVDGLRGRALADDLGWTAKRADAVRQRVRRRLRAFDASIHDPDRFVVRGNSRVLSYREHLDSGYFCYTLAKLGPEFLEIMQAEREYLAHRQK